MAHHDIDTVLSWRGRAVHDSTGEKIGTVGDVFLDRETDRPAWIGVKTGLFGTRESYVPLSAAAMVDGRLQVPYSKDQVKDAPHVDPDVSLTQEEERRLYDHYGERYAAAPGEEEVANQSGDAMIRSEEEVRVGHIERRPAERVRIRKVMVTDQVEKTVPVRKEVIALEHEPPPEGEIESVEELDDRPGGPRDAPGGSRST